jgi:hypothetical protein
MVNGHRKKPFSGKQKKKQLQAKRTKNASKKEEGKQLFKKLKYKLCFFTPLVFNTVFTLIVLTNFICNYKNDRIIKSLRIIFFLSFYLKIQITKNLRR